MRKEPGDLTSFSGEMPPFEAKKKPTTGVNYINGENALTENCHAEAKGMATYSESDQSTLVENTDTENPDHEPSYGSDQGTVTEGNIDVDLTMVRNDEIFPRPYVDDSTGKRMVELVQYTTVSLDHCGISGIESRQPNSDQDEIEVLFHHAGDKFWVYVPYGYVKNRDCFK
ncbi:hypothetical protein EYZ11_011471 [Aspergillus tanneri]|uniref:Uncharacterized protein n=1 Tax=Aspergillus tanneri TaxID=1220188 RepID=A0A4S3J3C6_9EURO|nr:hypothetical protein EYZ11_011471 [Aspergillus tanneri]